MNISYQEFKAIFFQSMQAVLNNTVTEITDDVTFADAGIDSLDRMNLLLDLEERLEMDLGEIDLGVLNTLEVLYQSLAQKTE